MNTTDMIRAACSRGLTQEQIAKRSGTSQPTIAKLLSGDYTLESACKRKVDNWLSAWLQIVTFGGDEFVLQIGCKGKLEV